MITDIYAINYTARGKFDFNRAILSRTRKRCFFDEYRRMESKGGRSRSRARGGITLSRARKGTYYLLLNINRTLSFIPPRRRRR